MNRIREILIQELGEEQGARIYALISRHFAEEYEYLVGNFSGHPQAKKASDGKLARNQDVIAYLQGLPLPQ